MHEGAACENKGILPEGIAADRARVRMPGTGAGPAAGPSMQQDGYSIQVTDISLNFGYRYVF